LVTNLSTTSSITIDSYSFDPKASQTVATISNAMATAQAKGQISITNLSGGSNSSLGSIDIDQATPGVTNGVVVDSSVLPTGAATSANPSTILAKLSNDPATQTTLAAVLAKLSSDPATQTTLAAVLAAIQASIPAGTAIIDKIGIDQTTPGTTDHVTGSSFFAPVSANFTRPANTTDYASGQLIANSVTAGSVNPLALAVARANDKTGMIRRLRLKVNDAAWLNATIRVHLYRDSPTCANGDGRAWSTTESNYIGYSDIVLDRQFSDPIV
jgi:hypothetical protein